MRYASACLVVLLCFGLRLLVCGCEFGVLQTLVLGAVLVCDLDAVLVARDSL